MGLTRAVRRCDSPNGSVVTPASPYRNGQDVSFGPKDTGRWPEGLLALPGRGWWAPCPGRLAPCRWSGCFQERFKRVGELCGAFDWPEMASGEFGQGEIESGGQGGRGPVRQLAA